MDFIKNVYEQIITFCSELGQTFFFPLFAVCCLRIWLSMSMWPSEWCIYISEVLRCWNVNYSRHFIMPPRVVVLHVFTSLSWQWKQKKQRYAGEEKQETIWHSIKIIKQLSSLWFIAFQLFFFHSLRELFLKWLNCSL